LQEEVVMRAEVKRQLIEALRNGAYRQVRGVLRSADGFCVLGVLCDISGLSCWDPATGAYADGHHYAPPQVLVWAGLGEREAGALMWMNDRGVDFASLADRIEADAYELTSQPPPGVDHDALLAACQAVQDVDWSQRDGRDPPPPTPAVIFIVPKPQFLRVALAA
jgi:hypothetical protein